MENNNLSEDILNLMLVAYGQGYSDGKDGDYASEDGFRTDAGLMIMNMLSKNGISE